MFPKNFANLWKCAILGSFRWQTLLIFQIKSSSRIFENVTAKWTFCVQQFFSAENNLQCSHYKN